MSKTIEYQQRLHSWTVTGLWQVLAGHDSRQTLGLWHVFLICTKIIICIVTRMSGRVGPFHSSSFRGIWGAFGPYLRAFSPYLRACGPWSWWEWVNNVPNYLCSKIQLSTLNKKVQRTLMSSKSWTGDLEDSGGFWLGFWFLIMMGMENNVPNNLC